MDILAQRMAHDATPIVASSGPFFPAIGSPTICSVLNTEKAVDNPAPYEHTMLAIGSDRIGVAFHGIALIVILRLKGVLSRAGHADLRGRSGSLGKEGRDLEAGCSAQRLRLTRGGHRRATPSAPGRGWAAAAFLTASYSVSGAMSAPFGHTTVPPSMKNRWK